MDISLPKSAAYVVVGAGMHGMSTAWHLAMALEKSGKGKGSDVVLLDKTGPGAGATGIACGCVRNLYMTSPLHTILRHSVDVWQSDPVELRLPAGRLRFGRRGEPGGRLRENAQEPERRRLPVGCLCRQGGQEASSSPSGPTSTSSGPMSCCTKSRRAMPAPTSRCRVFTTNAMQWGVRCIFGSAVNGYDMQNGRIAAVKTTHGDIKADCVVICAGAWITQHWDWLKLPDKLDMRYPDGGVAKNQDMWTYWRLLEGEVYLKDGHRYRTADDRDPPVLHVELMNTPVVTEDGQEFPDKHFYMYVRYAAERVGAPGVQGGTIPIKMGPKATLDPYGHANDEYQADPWFEDYYMATLAYLFDRFKGYRQSIQEAPQRRHRRLHARTRCRSSTGSPTTPTWWPIQQSRLQNDRRRQAAWPSTSSPARPSPELAPFGLSRYAAGTHVRRSELQLPVGVNRKNVAFVEELPGANTQGGTLREARENLVEAIELVLDANRALAEEYVAGRKVIRERIDVPAA